VVLFALAPRAVATHVAHGGVAYAIVDGAFARLEGTRATPLGRVADAPLSFGGAALHNVANCLGAAAAAWALGIPDHAVTIALHAFGAADNPGRGRVVDLPTGARALVDFAHNADGYRNLFALARALAPTGRLFLTMMVAGDRTDEDVAGIAAEIALHRPATVFLFDTPSLLRGRPAGEMPALIARHLAALSIPTATADSEPAAVAAALAATAPGDLLLVAPNIDRPGVAALLGS
ncbi:MAG TPA: cyanophycin synthetase, partial [Kofleriaceae bacterium]|nr:cyanophycin synthetase [Kofleriaceae bacterium]